MAYVGSSAAAQAAYLFASGSCLPQPLVRVSPTIFVSLKQRIITIIHSKKRRGSQHIYFGILDDQIIIYTLSRTELAVTIDIEAEKLCKTLSL